MNLAELESKRGYVVGCASRLRERLGLPGVAEEVAIKAIMGQIELESHKFTPGVLAKANFNPQPKTGKK